MKYPKERQERENNFFFFFIFVFIFQYIINKIFFNNKNKKNIKIFNKTYNKVLIFKNGKNVYNVLKLCIFYKSIANKKTYYFYTISILDFLLFFIGLLFTKIDFVR